MPEELAEQQVLAAMEACLPTDTAALVVVAADLLLLAALAVQVRGQVKLARLEVVAEPQLPETALLLGLQLEQGMAQLADLYKITNFDESTHEISVYFRDVRTIAPTQIKLYITDGMYPEGVELDNYIMSFCPSLPSDDTNPKELAKNSSYIHGLVKEPSKLKQSVIDAKNLALQRRLVSLYSSDWTQLPDAQNSMDEQDKKLWLSYRQDLRDITKQAGWPTDVVWPKVPHMFEVTIYE
jgi:hypothetical protein